MGISERLKVVIEANATDLAGFSRLVQVPYRTLQNYVHGTRARPRHDILERICTRTGVDLRWLVAGEGSMYPPGAPDVHQEESATVPIVSSATIPEGMEGAQKRIEALLAVLAQIPEGARDAVIDECFARAATAQQLAELRRAVGLEPEAKKKAG